jgi:serine protease Do
MKKPLAITALALILAACLPENSSISAARAEVPPAAAPAAAAPAPAAPALRGLPDFADLVEKIGPAVVNISVDQAIQVDDENPFASDPFYDFLRRFGVPAPGMPGLPGQQPRNRHGIGSGFIVSSDGYVLTNAHVVGSDNAEVTVKLTDKREFKAKVVGVDPRTDVAVIKIDARNLPTVAIGDAEHARVGEWVVALGSPFGFEQTVTAGIISAKARRLPDESYVPFIQTDVAINPGNSGGPLFDLNGRVIGINSQIYSRSGGFMGISFAIPIDVAMTVKDQLVQHGRVQRGRLGVYIQEVSPELAPSFGLDKPRGALVAQVEPGSAADRAGLKPGDVVLKVDGKDLSESVELPRIIGDKRPGSKVALNVWRDKKSVSVTVVLDELTQKGAVAANNSSPDKNTRSKLDKLGLGVRAINAQDAARLGVSGGLIVEAVGGLAARGGLQTGDVILALNNQPVTTPAQFHQLIEKAGKRFALLIQRGESRIFVPLKFD